MEPSTELSIIYDSVILHGTDSVDLKITLDYYPKGNFNVSSSTSFYYKINNINLNKAYNYPFEIGLIDPFRTNEIGATFKNFELQLNKISTGSFTDNIVHASEK